MEERDRLGQTVEEVAVVGVVDVEDEGADLVTRGCASVVGAHTAVGKGKGAEGSTGEWEGMVRKRNGAAWSSNARILYTKVYSDKH
jgi:hypothetical protein